MPLRFIHIVLYISTLFFCIYEWYPIVCLCHSLSTYPLEDIWTFFWFWSVINLDVIIVHMQVFFVNTFSFLKDKSLGLALLGHLVSVCLAL